MAQKKYKTPIDKLILLGILAGAYIAMGASLSVLIAYGMPEVSQDNPAVSKLLSGALFPLGLILIILVGGELFTGNTSYLIPGIREKLIPARYLPLNWTVVYLSNLVGAVLFAYLFVHLTGLFDTEPWRSAIVHIAEAKVATPWYAVLLKGVVANWLVCLSVWLGLSSDTMLGRVFGIWFPVMAFVAMGMEHSVANMFYLPMGMMTGAHFSIGEMVINNLIPATIGNIIGGTLFVGCTYSYLYGARREQP